MDITKDKPTKRRPERSAQIQYMSELHHFTAVELDHRKILHKHTKDKKTLEIMRDLRTQLMTRAEGRNFSCMVTSLVANGGASYFATNLAAVIALDDTKTSVLVDGNFYSPSLDNLIFTEADRGLNAFLTQTNLGVENVVYASAIPRVRVVPVGGDNTSATEKLASLRAKQFFDELKNRYIDRYIICDAPAMSEHSADNRLLANLCDFVILVVPFGRVEPEELTHCAEAFGDKLAGVVFNHP